MAITPEKLNPQDQLLIDSATNAVVGVRGGRGGADMLPARVQYSGAVQIGMVDAFGNPVGAPLTITASASPAIVGTTLNVTVAPGYAITPGTLQWVIDKSDGAGPVAISGATGTSYQLTINEVTPGQNAVLYKVYPTAILSNVQAAAFGVPRGPVLYSAYMAQKMRGDSQFATGGSGLNSSFYKVEFDGNFDSVQWFVSSKVTSGTAGTYKVQFAVTDEIRVDTNTRALLPMRAGVAYNDLSANGWKNATFAGAASATIGLAPNLGNNNNVISMATDALPLSSIARADGKAGGILLIKVVQTNASGQYTQESDGNATWDGARGIQPWFREWFPISDYGVDIIANLTPIPTNVAESATGYTMMGYPVVHTTTSKPTDLIMFTGDSRKEAAYSTYEFNNPTRQSVMSLSSASHPLSVVNLAGSGHSQTQYLEVALDALTNGLKPTVIQLPAFSQNGFSNYATFKAANDAFMASARALPGLANVKFVIDTDYYVGGYTGGAEIDRQSCIAYAKSLANGTNVFVFDSDAIMTDYTNPAAPVLRPAYMNADGVHANQAGQDAMTYGDGTHPGLQSVYRSILGI